MAISINGTGITSANIADGAITNADIADVAASKLTGALPAISGAALTNLPAGGLSAASDAEVRTGTSTAVAVTPANVKATQVGWGQTWTNVNASRSLGTTYTNSTGRPIELCVHLRCNSSGNQVSQLYIDGVIVGYVGQGSSAAPDTRGCWLITPIILDGSTYSVTTGMLKDYWFELR